ncbi:MAG TPA: 4Fe-4S binding protein [Lachnospiraceae bacterium]|nr:4Fe-4S binding protein [Lachnospiraceae bacterium]
MKRQMIRKCILIVMLLLFPITIWYFSPYLIIQAATEHVINGSFLVFVLMLISSTFLGRVFCSYLCPIGGLQECAALENDNSPKQGWRNKIKYIIWLLWITAIVFCFILSKGNINVNPFYMTDHGISVSSIYNYVIYYGVVFLVFIPSILLGKRVFCHYFCWMAPFMVIGSTIGRCLHIPQLHVRTDKGKCISCKQCNKNCPMSLDVESMVKTGSCRSSECIQCGVCIDTCPRKVLSYRYKK